MLCYRSQLQSLDFYFLVFFHLVWFRRLRRRWRLLICPHHLCGSFCWPFWIWQCCDRWFSWSYQNNVAQCLRAFDSQFRAEGSMQKSIQRQQLCNRTSKFQATTKLSPNCNKSSAIQSRWHNWVPPQCRSQFHVIYGIVRIECFISTLEFVI